MNRIKFFCYILLLTTGFALCSCSGDEPELTGAFPKSALRMSANSNEVLSAVGAPKSKSTPSGIAVPAVGEFMVTFTAAGESEPLARYLYSEMPEIISLPVGDYLISATCGANAPAAWNAPYFQGETTTTVTADDVTLANPIVCTIVNTRVSIVFDESVASAMSADSKVELAANGETLMVTPAEAAAGSVFVAATGEPITATFRGRVNGSPVTATHTVAASLPNHHFRITFRYDSQIHE